MNPRPTGGLHSLVTQDFVDMMAAAGGGTLPAITWGDFGLTEADVFAVLGSMISSVTDPEILTARSHFDDALETAALRQLGDLIDPNLV